MPVVNNRLTVTSIALFAVLALVGAAEKDVRFIPGRAASYPTKQTNDKVTIAAVPMFLVFIQPDICNGCGYCLPACPFGVPELSALDADGVRLVSRLVWNFS